MKAKIPVLLSLLCSLASLSVDAAPIRWRSADIQYAAEGKDVKDVLRDLAASQNIAANVAPGVSGAVSGKMKMSPQRFSTRSPRRSALSGITTAPCCT